MVQFLNFWEFPRLSESSRISSWPLQFTSWVRVVQDRWSVLEAKRLLGLVLQLPVLTGIMVEESNESAGVTGGPWVMIVIWLMLITGSKTLLCWGYENVCDCGIESIFLTPLTLSSDDSSNFPSSKSFIGENSVPSESLWVCLTKLTSDSVESSFTRFLQRSKEW